MPRMLVLVGAVLILTALTQIGGAALLIAIAAALLLRFGKLASDSRHIRRGVHVHDNSRRAVQGA